MKLGFVKKIGIEKLILLGIAGVILVVFSFSSSDNINKNETKETITNNVENNIFDYENVLEERLKKLLKEMDGVGEVEVMVKVKNSGKKIIESETSITSTITDESDSNGGNRNVNEISQSESKIYKSEDGDEVPYIVNENEPEIEGVAVIAEGGDDVMVASKIIEVVKAVLGVEAHKISVMKKNS